MLVVAVLLALLAVRQLGVRRRSCSSCWRRGFDRAMRKRPPRPAPAVGAVIARRRRARRPRGHRRRRSRLRSPNLTRALPRTLPPTRRLRLPVASGAQVYGGIEFADWLLWTHPELAGKVVFDVRYELLPASEVKRLVLFDAGSGPIRRSARPAAYVLDPDVEKTRVKGLRPDVRTVYKTDHAVVAVVRNGQ